MQVKFPEYMFKDKASIVTLLLIVALTTFTIPILNIETKKESRLCIRSFSVLILRL